MFCKPCQGRLRVLLLRKAWAGKSKVDADVLDNLEEVLVTSDVGVDTTLKIIKRIEDRVSNNKYLGTGELNNILISAGLSLLFLIWPVYNLAVPSII